MSEQSISAAQIFDGCSFQSQKQIIWEKDHIIAIKDCSKLPQNSKIILPGFINLHCHLELTALEGLLPQKKDFPQWVEVLQKHTAAFSTHDWEKSVQKGLDLSLQSGVTSIFDVGNSGATWSAEISTPIRLWAAVELLGNAGEDTLPPPLGPPKHRRGYSAHALYSCGGDCWHKAKDFCQKNDFPFSFHLAESLAEHKLLTQGQGIMRSWLDAKTPHHNFKKPGLAPLARALKLGVLQGSIAVHGNTLSPEDLQNLAQNQCGLVHCPQSAEWFGHPPLDMLSCDKSDLPVSIGSDSLASAHSLSLWEQMAVFAKNHPHYSVEEVLARVTSVPAQILGEESSLGSLTPGSKADFMVVEWGQNWEQLPQVQQVYISGKLVYENI